MKIRTKVVIIGFVMIIALTMRHYVKDETYAFEPKPPVSNVIISPTGIW